MPVCSNCGNGQFYESAGFFYCNVCETQCHDLQKTVQEKDYGTQNINRTSQHWTQPDIVDQTLILESVPQEIQLFLKGESASLFLLADIILRAQIHWLRENAGVSLAFEKTVKNVWFR